MNDRSSSRNARQHILSLMMPCYIFRTLILPTWGLALLVGVLPFEIGMWIFHKRYTYEKKLFRLPAEFLLRDILVVRQCERAKFESSTELITRRAIWEIYMLVCWAFLARNESVKVFFCVFLEGNGFMQAAVRSKKWSREVKEYMSKTEHDLQRVASHEI